MTLGVRRGKKKKKRRTPELNHYRRSRSPQVSCEHSIQTGQLSGHGNDWSIRPGPPKCYTKLSVHKNKDKKWTATKQCGGNKSFAYRLGWTPHNCWEAVMLTLQQWLQIHSRKQFSGKLGLPSTLDTQTREKQLKYFCWCPCPAWLDLQSRQPTTTGIVANITGISVANSQSTAWNSYAYGKNNDLRGKEGTSREIQRI